MFHYEVPERVDHLSFEREVSFVSSQKKLQRVKNLVSTCTKRANSPTPPLPNLNGWLCVNVHLKPG